VARRNATDSESDGGNWTDRYRGDRGDSGKGWHRDDKGRRYRDERAVRVYADATERDEAMEERYARWPACCLGHGLVCCTSVLACVSAHRRELVAEYVAWGERQHMVSFVGDREAMQEWAVLTFGDRLFPAAIGVFMAAVREQLQPGARKAPKQPRVTPGLTDEQRQRQMLVAVHKLSEGMAMPAAPTKREAEAEANEQRAAMADQRDAANW
jgi:hypothetical protein